MELKQVINDLHLQDKSIEDEDLNTYIVMLDDSEEYAKVYSVISKLETYDLDYENIVCTEHSNIMPYLTDSWDVTLEANFDEDVYKVIIEEAKED